MPSVPLDMYLYYYLQHRRSRSRYASWEYDPTFSHCGLLELKFDGHTLILKGGTKTCSYPAVAGKPANGKFDEMHYSPQRQRLEKGALKDGEYGPIPEGTYWIRPDELWKIPFYRLGYPSSAWGNFLVRIHPFTTNQMYGRGGFTIHGGAQPGSAGCIDLAGHMDRFAQDLKREVGFNQLCQIHLTVKYQ